MTFLGFGQRWRNWISMLWCMASSAFLLNGKPGPRILHARGVRQGDPLSPMIFLLAIEPLHRLFQHAHNTGVLQYLDDSCHNFRMSLYADNAALFVRPARQDVTNTNLILKIFAEASGLIMNLTKTEVYPIRCTGIDLQEVLGTQQVIANFPCTYLGIPLHYKNLPKNSIQPLVSKVEHRLPGWKRKSMA